MYITHGVCLQLRLFVLIVVFVGSVSSSQAKAIGEYNYKPVGNFIAVEGSSVTIYNQNRALIKQKHLFDLEKGINGIDWDELPSTIDIHSVSLRGADNAKSIEVKEQNYQYDSLNSNTILNHSIGKTVHLRRYLNDGRSEEQSGILLSSDRLIKVGDRYVLNPDGQLEIEELPTGLVSKPKISFLVKVQESGSKNLLLTYETGNINWQCDYILTLNNNQDKGNLSGWITLDNQCGVSFKKSNLKLVAGNVNNVNPVPMGMAYRKSFAVASQEAAPIAESAFADYHLYTFPEAVDLNNSETKRLSLVERQSIPVVKKYVFDQQFYGYEPPKQKTPVQIKLEFQNDEKYKQPFPAGQVRVYQEDLDKEQQLIGADQISHTPAGEKIMVNIGEAFDVLGEKTHVNSEQTAEHRRLDTYKVTFSNHLDKDIFVTDIEHCPDLAIFISDSPFTKLNSGTYKLDVAVPANGTAEIIYQIKNRK